MRKTFVRTALPLLAAVLLNGPIFGQLRQIYLDSDSSNSINRLSFFSPSEGYVAFTRWIGHTTDSGRTFTKLYITNSNVNYNGYSVNLTFGFGIAGVKAFSANTLIAYGDYGLVPAILYSANGGANWALIFQSQYSQTDFNGGVTDMLFPQNDNTGYAIDADRILKTTNGGQGWSVVATAPNSFFNHLEAVDDNTVFAMSTGAQTPTLLETTNGGSTWQPVGFPSVSGGVMTYTCFLNATTGWMNLYDPNYNQYFYKTTNGGASWTLIDNLATPPYSCGKMHFTDANTGYALVPPFQVYKTLNGGALWEPLSRDNQITYLGYGLNDLQFFSSTQFWAGGGHGYLELSTNSGGTPIPTAYFAIDTTNEYTTGTVNLLNYSNPSYQSKWLVNGAQIATSYNASYTHTLSRFADTIVLIVTSGGISDTVTKYQYFQVPNLPVISSFAPQGGGSGTLVNINGTGLSSVTAVSFGGTPASSFTIVSDKVITAVLANGASGNVTVTDIHGSYSVPGFTYYPPPASAPPVITSIVPAAGPMGSIVTIQGTGFGGSPSANAVFFGTIRATVQSASPTAIVCTIPPGASFGTVSVLNRSDALTCQSQEPFNVSFADSSNFTPSSFSAVFSQTFNEYTYPNLVVGKDLDGDGKPDLLADINFSGSDSLIVYLNTTTGGSLSFGPATSVRPVGGSQVGLLGGNMDVNDIDGDGLPDIVFATNSPFLTVIRNTSTRGHLAFTGPVTVPAPDGTQAAIITDLDNDGKNDIAAACYNQGYLSVARNTGAPGLMAFAATQYFSSGGNAKAIAAGDLDGDGKKDIVTYNDLVGNTTTSVVSCFRNTSTPGSISFAPRIDLSVNGYGLQSGFVAIADYDGDGKPDLIVSNDGFYYIFLNTSTPGNISFAPAVTVNFPLSSQGVSLSNYSGSSHPDCISGGFVSRDYLLIRNISSPGVIANQSLQDFPGVYPNNPSVYFTNGTDFDMDGRTDIALTGTNDNNFVILKNEIGVPLPFQTCTTGTSTLSSDVTGTVYQWQRNTGSGYVNLTDNDTVSGTATANLTFINAPVAWNGYKYRCLVGSLYSSVYNLVVITSIDHGISISGSDSVPCYGAPVTFYATMHDTSNNYMIYWWVNDGNGTGTNTAGSSFTSTTLQDKDKVQALLYMTNACGYHVDTSQAIIMKVTEVPDSITISTPTTTICGSDSVTFTATAVNPGSNPIYNWTLNRYAQPQTGPVFTFSPSTYGAYYGVNNGVNRIQATLQSSQACADPTGPVSNLIQITFVTPGSMSVTVDPSSTTICQGSGADFSLFISIIGEGGGNMSYNWLVNGVSTGDTSPFLSTTALNNNDAVQCKISSDAPCLTPDSAISNPIVMTVNPVVSPAVSISPADTVVCAGSDPVFTARPLNGGPAPTYQWWSNGAAVGGNQPTYTVTQPVNGSAITVTLTSNASCLLTDTVTSGPVLLSVNSPSVHIAGDTALSAGATASFSATANNAGANPTYQWQDSSAIHSWQNTGVSEAMITYNPTTSGDRLRCIITDASGCSAISNTITFNLSGGASGTAYYPNPAYSVLNIVNTDPGDPLVALSVTDVFGNQCLALYGLNGQDLVRVDVASLVKGIYFVTMIRASGKPSHFSFIRL
jgi:photosystem II stability/assembly factor-like uncharacterized protein